MMSFALQSLLATAGGQEDMVQAMREAFASGPSTNDLIYLAVGVSLLGLGVLLAVRHFNRQSRSTTVDPREYLTMGADLLGLSEQERRDLDRIATLADLPQPAAMLLSPALMARATRAARLARDAELNSRLNKLSHKLFEQPLPDDTALATIDEDAKR